MHMQRGGAPLSGTPMAAPQQPQLPPSGPDVLPRWALRRVQGPLWREAPLGAGVETIGFDPRQLALEEARRQLNARAAARGAAAAAAVKHMAALGLNVSGGGSAQHQQDGGPGDGGSSDRLLLAERLRTRLLIEHRMHGLLSRQRALREAVVKEQQALMVMPERSYRKLTRELERARLDAARLAQRKVTPEFDAAMKRAMQRRRRMLDDSWAAKQRCDARNKAVLRAHERMRREAARVNGDALARRRAHEAMLAQDYDAYLRHVKAEGEQRYEQLATFLTKTEQYLTTLGSKIAQLKRVHERQEAAAAARSAALARGASQEDAEAAAAAASAAAVAADGDGSVPQGAYYSLAHTIGEKVTRQPDMLRLGRLREYQLIGLQWMVSLYNNRLNGILADEMGLGKTVQVMALIAYLWESKGNRGPHLIIVPNAVMVNWRSELRLWLPGVDVVYYVGHRQDRERLFADRVAGGSFNVLVTTYEFIMKDRPKLCRIKWRYLIIDEAQRMKDRDSKLSRDLDYFDCQNRLLLTGTPLQNDLSELWALLNLLLPHVFDSFSQFQSWFDTGAAGSQQQQAGSDEWLAREKRVIVISRLHQILEPFMLRRRVEDVERKLPAKVTHVVYAPMTAFQAAAYDWVKATSTLRCDPAFLIGAAARAKRAYAPLHNKAMELRKLCNHPCLSYPPERGGHLGGGELLVRTCGKLWLLDRMLVKLHATGHRVLLFSTMTRMLDTLEQYLAWRASDQGGHMRMPWCRIDGTTSLEDRETAISAFNAPGSSFFIFLLSIRAAGRGLNLQTADTVVVYDPDPNPKNEEQAVARSHRIGQTREVRVFHMEAVADVRDAAHDAEAEQEDNGGGAWLDEDSDDDQEAAARSGGQVRRDYTGGYRRRQRRATVGSVESLVRNTIQAQKIEMADEVINAGRFDQNTTHEERRATLEELLREGRAEGPASHVVPRLRDLNAMLARSPEELRTFQAMDRDSRIFWPTWQSNAGELPAWLRYTAQEVNHAQLLTAKARPGRAGQEAARELALTANLEGDGGDLGRGRRGTAQRQAATSQRNAAVRLYEEGLLEADQIDDPEAVAAALQKEAAKKRVSSRQPAPPKRQVFKFSIKLAERPIDADEPGRAAAADEPSAGAVGGADADTVLLLDLGVGPGAGGADGDDDLDDEDRHASASEGDEPADVSRGVAGDSDDGDGDDEEDGDEALRSKRARMA